MDIFELKSVDAVIRIPALNKDLKLCDPNHMKKIALQKKFDVLKKKMEIEPGNYAEEVYLLNCEQVKLYLPDITELDFEKIGSAAFFSILNSVTGLAIEKFGAVVEKVGEAGK